MKDEMLRCKRCHEPIHCWYDASTNLVSVGCRFRGCPLTVVGAIPAHDGAVVIFQSALLPTVNAAEEKP